jgi:Fic family protein
MFLGGYFMINRALDLAIINNKISTFSKKLKDAYYNYLINEFGILFTFHSNRIEGTNNSLTLNDTKNILNNTFNQTNDKNKIREIKETINHQKAFRYIFEAEDKNILNIIKKLHSIVLKDIITSAGEYKQTPNYMINSKGEEIIFTKPSLVEKQMQELKQKYDNEFQKLPVIERAVMLHMAIVNIHPFADGNGRVARLILNYELIKNIYPPIIINESQKLSYYALLEEININTDYENSPLSFGSIKLFYETVQQLSVLTFKNMQEYMKKL